MRLRDHRILLVTLFALAILLIWDASGGDLVLARVAGTPFGFPLRANHWLSAVVHEGGKNLSWLLVLALLLAVRWPFGFLRVLSTAERAQLVLGILAAVGTVSLLKQLSATSCPWDLREFGGTANHVSHWARGVRDGGPGGCFPAGHASAAFAFLAGWFVLRRRVPRVAAWWLGCALVAGLVFGLAQQWRGAHYMSHTLWTAWVCWVVGWGIDAGVQALTARRAAPSPPAARTPRAASS